MGSHLRAGAPVVHHRRSLVPVTRSFLLRLPGTQAGLAWNRPIGVRIEDSAGRRWLRITDPTRRIQVGLLAAGVAAAVVVGSLAKRRRPRRGFLGRLR